MLEWLQTQITNPSQPSRKQQPVKVPAPDVGERTEQPNASPVEDAPDALPAEGVSDEQTSTDGSPVLEEGEAAAPEPKAESTPDQEESEQEPMETGRIHEEL